jgi:magnesium-protoporphyrin O-methyltransferase
MVKEAERRAVEAGVQKGQISFLASDLESLSGSYNTVV